MPNPVAKRLERELRRQVTSAPPRAGDDRPPESEHIQTQTLSDSKLGDSILLITLFGKYRDYYSETVAAMWRNSKSQY